MAPSPVIDMPTPMALLLFSLKNEFIARVNAAITAATPIAEKETILNFNSNSNEFELTHTSAPVCVNY